MRNNTWEVIPSKSAAYHNALPRIWFFECNSKTDWIIFKFKAGYFVRGYFHKRLSPKHLSLYSPAV